MTSLELPAQAPDNPTGQWHTDPAVLDRFVAIQMQELDVRREEATIRQGQLDLERLEKEQAHEYALRFLDANVVDRQNQRLAEGRTMRWGVTVVIGIVLAFLVLAVLAMYLNKDALLMEMIRIAGYGGGGGGVGYAIGNNKRRNHQEPPREPSPPGV